MGVEGLGAGGGWEGCSVRLAGVCGVALIFILR